LLSVETRRPAGFAFGQHEDRTPTHGYEPTREAAMAAFTKSWRRHCPAVIIGGAYPRRVNAPTCSGRALASRQVLVLVEMQREAANLRAEMLREREFVLEVVGTAIGEFSNKRAFAIALALGGVPGSGNSDGSLLT
jgi:hypothetical protein